MRLAKLDLPDDKVILPFGDLDSVMPDFPGPYAVKVIASEISHKSDSKGVILGLSDFDQLKTAVRDIQNRFMKEPSVGYYGCLVQRMAAHIPGTYELIVGGKRDAQFGPLVLVGYGGVLVEVFAKASLRMAPLSDREVDEMIDELPGSEIFRGVRGRDPIDRESLRRTISTVASLMAEFPSIDQIDVNPVWVSRSGAIALDARIFVKN
jgi:acyl-CoA synthetase (NDP forming)